MSDGLKKVGQSSLNERLAKVDHEFKDYLSSLIYKMDFREERLGTFSPLDAVAEFSPRGIQAVDEISREEMMNNDRAFHKLLANMLYHCQPGSLSDDDMEQISGINGRELQL